MYKRKFADDLLAAACKKAKINSCKQAFRAAPTTLLSFSPPALIVPELLKKRKRLEECEAAFRNQEPKRMKSSHVGSNWIKYPPSLSPASKYQILSNQTFSRIEDDDNNPKSAAKKTTTTNAVLPIRLARPQRPGPAFTDPSIKENKARKKIEKKQTEKKKTTTQQQVQENDEQQKQRNPKPPAPTVSLPSLKYSHILRDWYAAELDHLDPIIR
ncbi:hypothetical protein ACQKWADRAFT_278059 [Trichoderma austrokoningii]